MLRLVAALASFFLIGSLLQAATDEEHRPNLLLHAKLLRRLKRDKERQTLRWANFESRVKTVPNSPERGFELALYYAVTGDVEAGQSATAWTQAHPCDIRQVALVADWVGSAIPAATQKCPSGKRSALEQMRDSAFLTIASGEKPVASPDFLPAMEHLRFDNGAPLYAAAEYLDAIRTATREDLRQREVGYFSDLPARFLLSLSPERLMRPGWQMHVAALAFVSLDPNLEGSQFLQSWAMEDEQTVQDGPGVAYELLWADPYLPGVSYRNMEPALYDEKKATLIARTTWDADACRIEIKPASVWSDEHCPPDWKTKRMQFGRLTLVPMTGRCAEVDARTPNTNVVLWAMAPGAKLLYPEAGEKESRNADGAGMWHVSAEIHGRICVAR